MTNYIKVVDNKLIFNDSEQTDKDLDGIVEGDNIVNTVSACRAYLSADQDDIASSGAGTYKIALNTVDYDIGSNFDTTNNCFVVGTAGKYLILATVCFETTDLSAGQYGASIYVDPVGAGGIAVAQAGGRQFSDDAGKINNCNAMAILNLAVDDKIYLYTYTDDTNVDIDSGIALTSMCVQYLGV